MVSSPFDRFWDISVVSAGRPVMTNSRIRRALPAVVCVVLLLAASITAQQVPRLDSYKGVAVRILQSNNAGDIHHIIDPATNTVVGLIRGCPYAHNLTVHPDGLYYYCANESQRTDRRLRYEDAEAGAADQAVVAAQQDRGQQEVPEDLRRHHLSGPKMSSAPGSRRPTAARFPPSSTSSTSPRTRSSRAFRFTLRSTTPT